ncbi:ribosomal protein L22 [Xylariomycetidae sp. FL2044]|nr:ribosomal protein L22 [Xylariomycetidae sp. FL2044]KAH9885630.1 ribosomal protein L22 [Xylariomycetidae sp. FL2044]
MSLHFPARRMTQSARAATGKPSLHLRYLLPRTQSRSAWFGWGSKSSNTSDAPTLAGSPLVKELDKREKQRRMAEKMLNRTAGESIFDEDIKHAEESKPEFERSVGGSSLASSGMKEHMQPAVDPDPRWRIRYQKRKIIQMVKANGKLTREQRIRLSEKEHASSSTPLPTSTKKLVKLAHQIAGKTVDEAITQMQFSKKKMAREVKWQLEEARDQAIVSLGMGLGVANGEVLRQPKKIQTKDGKWIDVQDPSTLYVDQAWVTKGPLRGARKQYHSRGRASVMWKPTTAISLVLKEERTRIRQHEDRVEKEAKKAPWVHLPNRPVTAQRPYYCW